jgi:hypothetical protein
MDENMLVNTQKIKKKVTENLFGQTEDVTEENGLMENSMAKEHMLQVLDKKSTENGEKERELDGLLAAKWND